MRGQRRSQLSAQPRVCDTWKRGSPNFVEAARTLTARCGLRDRVEIRQANALALPFQNGTFDHVWSYAVTSRWPRHGRFSSSLRPFVLGPIAGRAPSS
jgi:hypothetical protein